MHSQTLQPNEPCPALPCRVVLHGLNSRMTNQGFPNLTSYITRPLPEPAASDPVNTLNCEQSVNLLGLYTPRDYSSRVRFTAVQDDSVMWRWSAEVNQGEAPKIDGPSAGPEIVRDEKDLLLIRDLKIPIEYVAPGANATTVVEIVMNVEGHGART